MATGFIKPLEDPPSEEQTPEADEAVVAYVRVTSWTTEAVPTPRAGKGLSEH